MPLEGTISVKSRAGGELIKLGEPAYHKAVKKVLQESSIPPWVRDSIPLLYIEGRLAAIWNLAVAVDCRIHEESPFDTLSSSGGQLGRGAAVPASEYADNWLEDTMPDMS